MKATKTFFLCTLLLACGNDSPDADAGQDATTDVASEGATKDATVDAKADVAIDSPAEATSDAPSEAASDAGLDAALDVALDAIVDAPADVAPEASGNCNGGCTKYSFYCSNANPSCQCVGLSNGQSPPVCDAAAANCLVDPCLTKSVQCINDQCVIQ